MTVDNQDMGMLSELKSKFEHPAQHIERVKSTNEMIVGRFVKRENELIASLFPNLPDDDALYLGAAYHYIIVNGLLPEDYDFAEFVTDVSLISRNLEKNQEYKLLEILDLIVRIYVQSITASFETFVMIIDEKSAKTPDVTVQSMVLYKHYVSTAEQVGEMISTDPDQVDVRVITAILLHGLNMMYRRKRNRIDIWAMNKIASELFEVYPLSTGTDLYWDIMYTHIMKPNYKEIVKMGQKTIDERLEVLERERKAGHASRYVRTTSTDDSGVGMAGESILYEVFRRGSSLTAERANKLERMFDASIRRAANEKYGKQDLPDPDMLLDLCAEMFAKMIASFPILAAGIIPPPDHMEFLESPRGYVSSNRGKIPMITKKKLQLLAGAGVSTSSMAKAFVRLAKKAASIDPDKKRMY
ncbi:MAG: hypothetical protein GF411_10980 [Candidatus Lokiarchaeota archaeon]|nr:hypothetical protein [Candidatus Lokiarchaeota archaeon]